jgi:hypothetical protein
LIVVKFKTPSLLQEHEMSPKSLRRTGLLCVLLAVAVAAWSQGLYWESTTAIGEKSIQTKTSYMPGKMRIDSDNGFTILRLDQEKMYMVNTEKKSYRATTFAELEAQLKEVNSRMSKQMQKMQEKLKDMPEEQRKMVEKMIQQQGMAGKETASKVNVKATGKTQSILGRACTQYSIVEDGKELGSIWATKDVKEYATMRSDMELYAKRFLSLQPGGKGLADGMYKVGGFPMQMEMGTGITTKVTGMESRSTPAAAFEVPAGYTKDETKLIPESKEK